MKLSDVVHVVLPCRTKVAIYGKDNTYCVLPFSKYQGKIPNNYNPNQYEIRTTSYGWTFIYMRSYSKLPKAGNIDEILESYQNKVKPQFIPFSLN